MKLVLALLSCGLASLFSPGARAYAFLTNARFAAATGTRDANSATYFQEGKGQGQGLRRNLLQSAETPVTTPAQLQNAVSAGVRHIVVQQHLDLSSLQLSKQESLLDVAVQSTVSITGDCAAKPGPVMSAVTGADLWPLLPRQCLLVTDASLLTVTNSSLWMDNLYIRLERSTRTPLLAVLITADELSTGLYLTGITLQGDGVFKRKASTDVFSCRGLKTSSPVYMQGCTMSHLGGNTGTLYSDASIAIVNTTIADHSYVDDYAVMYFDILASAWLRGVTFARNSSPRLVAAYSGVYSDRALHYYATEEGEYVTAPASPGAGADFLSPQDQFFQTATAGVARAPASVPAKAEGNADAVTAVATPEQLQQAVMHGARHIEVTDHMDLTLLDPVRHSDGSFMSGVMFGVLSDTTTSIRGNCSEAPQLQLEGPPLLPLLPGQCVLLVDMDFAHVGYGRLWMHNLYLRHVASARADGVYLVATTQASGWLWLTLTTLQGAGQYAYGAGATGLGAGSPTYVAGCRLTSLGGSRNVLYVDETSVRIVNSTFSESIVQEDSLAIIHIFDSGGAWLEGTVLVNNSAARPLIDSTDGGGFSRDVFTQLNTHTDYSLEEMTVRPADANAFLNGDELWFRDVRAIFPNVSITSEAAEEPPVTAVTVVTTAEELQAAAARAARHIELRSHLELTSLDTVGGYLLGSVSAATHTLRGNCTNAPVDTAALQLSGAPLRPLLEGQCIIVADHDMLEVSNGRLWVDNVYFRIGRSPRVPLPRLLTVYAVGRLWLTRSTLQGDGSIEPGQGDNGVELSLGPGATGLKTGLVCAQGVMFADLSGRVAAVEVHSAAHFVDCTFTDNAVTGTDVGVITAVSGKVWLQGCQFANNTASPALVALPSSVFYNDGPDKYYAVGGATEVQPKKAPLDTSAFLALPDNFVTDASGELGLQLQLEPANPAAPGAPVAAPTLTVTEAPQPGDATSADTPEATDGGGDGDDTPRQDGAGLVTPNATSDSITNVPSDNGTNWAAVGGGVAAAAIILLLLLCIICLLVIRLRRRGQNGDTAGHGVGGTDIAQPPGLPACASGPPGPSKHGRSEELSTAATLHGMATPGHQVAPTQGVMNHDMDEGYFAPMPDQISTPADAALTVGGHKATIGHMSPPAGLTMATSDATSASAQSICTRSVATATYNTPASAGETMVEQQKERLTTELDHLRRHNENFLGQYAVLPWTERREGGQGVVQFMRSARTEEAVAVKFFLSRNAFHAELELYGVDVLRSMMPAIRLELSNADGAERNSRGYSWPPCIVIEKGESLQEWRARMKPAFSTIVDALCLITERLAQLHGSGWVHRDLKPGNILRLPGQHSWTLMDFGCAARTGETVPITFSPSYAPPEVALALEHRKSVISADGAADMWALGIMAFELLNNEPVFPPIVSTRETIWAQLCGREVLPWEDGAAQQAVKLSQLRGLKRTILQCLQRQPAERPTAEQVLTQWRTLFDSRTATGNAIL